VIWGTYVLQKTDYLPWYLLGSGELDNIYKNHPIHPFPKDLKYYYLFTLGYYVNKSAEDLLHREKRNDFYEMMLHHVLTIELYVGSYMLNIVATGSLVVISLDWTNVFIGFSRAFTDTRYKLVVAVFGVSMLFAWYYFRLFVYPVVYYYGLYDMHREMNVRMGQDERFVLDCLTGLCTAMQVLNIWWGWLIT
jgi:very-long-chain ceramide synthase